MSGRETVYEIRDVEGVLVAKHIRIERSDGTKTFRWERDGKRGLDGMPVAELPLYGSEHLSARPDECVIVVEGEKAADALRDRGCLALGTVTGAKSTPSSKALSCLADRDVVLWADADGEAKKFAGERHMEHVAAALQGHAQSVRIIGVSDWTDGFDAADYSGSDDELRAVIDGAAPWEPQQEASAVLSIDDAMAPLIALEEDAAGDDVLRAVTQMAEMLIDAGATERSIARDTAIRHLKAVGIRAPAKIVDAALRDGASADAEVASHTTTLIELARERGVLFYDDQEKGYIDVVIDDHRETYSLKSAAFARWIRSVYFARFKVAPPAQSLADAIATLEGFALHEGTETPVFVRFAAGDDGVHYLDLGDPSWRAIEIEAGAWRIVSDPPVRFVRSTGQLPLPEPTPGRDLTRLAEFVNLESEDLPLVHAWLVAAVLSRSPYAVLALTGEQGGGKTTTARVLRALIDPIKAPLRSAPSDERDLVIAASKSGVVAFDNVSHIPPALSDALCRLSTGGGFGTRQLYTDDEEHIFESTRPILLNGITNFVVRDDLADRSVVVRAPRLTGRRREDEFRAAFETARPALLGALLDLAASVLKVLPEANAALHEAELPRMADYATIGTAVEMAGGQARDAFLIRFQGQRDRARADMLAEDPVGLGVLELMEKAPLWKGTASALLAALRAQSDDYSHSLPKGPRGLTAKLDRLTPALRAEGILFRRTRGRRRGIRLERTPESVSIGPRWPSDDEGEGLGPSPHAPVAPVAPVWLGIENRTQSSMRKPYDGAFAHPAAEPCSKCQVAAPTWKTAFASGCWHCSPPPNTADLLRPPEGTA